MPAFRSAVSATAVSDAAAVKAAVFAASTAANPTRRSPLWMSRQSKCRKSRKRAPHYGQTGSAVGDRFVYHNRIPLAANNSATTKAQLSPEGPAPVAASAEAAEEALPSTNVVSDEAETASEEAEESPVAENAAMIRTNAVSREMRQRPSKPQLKSLRPETVEASMNLVKLRKHPAQLLREAQRLESSGTPRMQQLLAQKRQEEYLAKAKDRRLKQKKMKADEDKQSVPSVTEADFPDWIPFQLRFRRKNATEIWNYFVAQQREQSKQLGEKALSVVKATERYNENYIDLWTHSLTIQSRPVGLLQDLIRPVFTRLGLDNRADLRVTAGCFANDIRQGGKQPRGMPKTPVSVSMLTPIVELYESGITELFVSPWPSFRNGFPNGYFDPLLMPTKQQNSENGSSDTANTSNRNISLIKRFLRDSQLAAARSKEMQNSSDRMLPILMESAWDEGH